MVTDQFPSDLSVEGYLKLQSESSYYYYYYISFQFRLGSSSSIVVVQESMKRRLLHNSCFREESRQLSTQIGSEGGRLRVARPGIAQ